MGGNGKQKEELKKREEKCCWEMGSKGRRGRKKRGERKGIGKKGKERRKWEMN